MFRSDIDPEREIVLVKCDTFELPKLSDDREEKSSVIDSPEKEDKGSVVIEEKRATNNVMDGEKAEEVWFVDSMMFSDGQKEGEFIFIVGKVYQSVVEFNKRSSYHLVDEKCFPTQKINKAVREIPVEILEGKKRLRVIPWFYNVGEEARMKNEKRA